MTMNYTRDYLDATDMISDYMDELRFLSSIFERFPQQKKHKGESCEKPIQTRY